MTEKTQREQNYDWFMERKKYLIKGSINITTLLNEVDRLVDDGISNNDALQIVFQMFGMFGGNYD